MGAHGATRSTERSDSTDVGFVAYFGFAKMSKRNRITSENGVFGWKLNRHEAHMKAEFINPFVTSTMNIFSTMLKMKPVKKGLYIKNKKISKHEISAFIGLAGDLNGFVTISFSENIALKISEAFLMEAKTTIDDDVVDVMGEMVNMVAGGAKKEFVDKGMPFKISIPSIITGKGHMLGVSSKNPCFGVAFELNGDEFDLEVAVSHSKR